jgi:hypothetical protein
VLLLVVGFFAFQWWSKTGRRLTAGSRRQERAIPAPTTMPVGTGGAGIPGNVLASAQAAAEKASPMRSEPPSDAEYPQIPGQTVAETRNPEPLQRRSMAPQPEGVGPESYGPVPTPENLRHPEQMFHQPGPAAAASRTSDVAAGRANQQSTPLSGNQQAFSPEMAQNGGALVGNTMFAFDGMEPTGFAAF